MSMSARSCLLLPIRPWSLVAAARAVSLRTAALISAASLFLLGAVWASLMLSQFDNPHSQLGDLLNGLTPTMLVFGILCGGIVSLLPFVGLMFTVILWGRDELRGRVLLLNHVALLVPIACFLALSVLASFGSTPWSITGEAKPTWTRWEPIQAGGGTAGLMLLTGLYGLNLLWALRRAGRQG